MKLELTYIFECPGGFKYVRNTPEEIISVFNENLQAIINDEKECNGRLVLLDSVLDTSGDFPKGRISIFCDGKIMHYELKTTVKRLN